MDLHEQFIQFETIDLSLFKVLDNRVEEDTLTLLHRIISCYNDKVKKNNNVDVKTLDTFRSLLCHKYQVLFHCLKEPEKICTGPLSFHMIDSIITWLQNTEDKKKITICYDILLLQMVLHCNINCVQQHLFTYRKMSNYEPNTSYMKTLNCFLQCIQLRDYLYQDVTAQIRDNFCAVYIKDVISWLKPNDETNWYLFASIFPRIVKFFRPEKILPSIWEFILHDLEDSKDFFAVLCIVTDILFPLNTEDITQTHYNVCCSEQLWHVLIKGLQSPTQQYRKQALFVLKSITKFMNTSKLEIKGYTITPFFCNVSEEEMMSMKSIQEKFFLVYEALEEKQQHLIIPALTHVPALIEGYQQHFSKHNCFNIIWMEVLFQRMLQHGNNVIIKQGIEFVSHRLQRLILNDEFCKLFFATLNNTFLYESAEHSIGIKEAIKTLLCSDVVKHETNLFAKTLHAISELIWAPIPLFYTLCSLEPSSFHNSPLKGEDLHIIKTILQKHLNMHSYIIRSASQIELFRIMANSIIEVHDFVLLVNILWEFSAEILNRKSLMWSQTGDWLRGVFTPKAIEDSIKMICEKYMTEPYPDISGVKFAFIIYILYDAKLILIEKKCPVKHILRQWLHCLKDINIRPYADSECSLNAIEFVSHSISLNQRDTAITDLFDSYMHSIMKFLMRCLKREAVKQNYENVDTYVNIAIILLKHMDLYMSEEDATCYLEKYLSKSCNILNNLDDYNKLTSLWALRIFNFCQKTCYIESYPESILNISDINISEGITDLSTKGKISSEYNLLLMQIIDQCIKHFVVKTEWADNTLHLFELGGKEIIPATASVLQAVVDNNLLENFKGRSKFETIFEMCWRHTFLDKRNSFFWPSIQTLLTVIVNSNFLKLSKSMDFTNRFIDQLLEESENLPKLKRVLLESMSNLAVDDFKKFQEPLISCLTHGFALRRDKKVEYQAYLYIKDNYSTHFPDNVLLIGHNMDATIRAHSTLLLLKIINHDSNFASMFLEVALKHLEKYQNKRYYNHSYIHKVKHRIMQVLLLLQPKLNQTATVTLQTLLCNLILSESNQHSVRLMQEWILIRIFKDNSNLHDNLWQLFEKAMEERPGCTNSIISIVYHIAVLSNISGRRQFITSAFKYISRCCLGQQYSMRLYSQVLLVKLCDAMKRYYNCQEVTSKYLSLYEAALASIKDGNLLKNSNKIQDDFYFNVFNPVDNYTLETIYYDLPRLSDMDQSEWIDPKLFEACSDKFKIYTFGDSHSLKLLNLDRQLSAVTTSPYLSSSNTGNESCQNESETNIYNFTNIQKKIDATLAMKTLYDDLSIISRSSNNSQKASQQDDGLIVVASLIDRLPNLGGLTRSCEIFCAKELVISNLNVTKHKEFQSLSVSADKWIPITEVKVHDLQQYLFKKKDEGWDLIGVEQTAYSTSLLNMKFNKKTVLVLGNEKDGIPANLIPIFDTCVEIPQAGIIRSLNVHVTGAICMWEYARQHTFV